MRRKKVKPAKFSSVGVVVGVIILGLFAYDRLQLGSTQPSFQSEAHLSGDVLIQQAFQNRSSDVQISGSGVVIKVLPDDLKGSRHQKFILKLSSGHTLMVAHNIDLAPRIASLKKGGLIEFNGEYEWNANGGVLHWTHHDPAGRHEGGWLKHNGRIYQ